MNICIMASGNGSNAENIINYVNTLENVNIAGVITDNESAYVLERAAKNDVEAVCLPFVRAEGESYKEAKIHHETSIYEWLKENEVEWILLAGYMRILSEELIDKFHDADLGVSKIINIHPSLLPSFPGKDAYQQAWSSGVKVSGVTVHFVDSGIDTGPVILQESFSRNEEDSLEEFVSRGLEVEYDLYRKALDILLNNKFKLKTIPGSDNKFVSLKEL